jgi:putative ABC transport system permease protein
MFSILLIKEFFQDLKAQKTRAILTTVAIAWGTLTMILLMAFGTGLSYRMRESLLNAADKMIYVFSGQTGKKYNGMPVGRDIRIQEGDCQLLLDNVPEIAAISPQMGAWDIRLRRGDKSASTYMEGVYPEFEFLRRMYPVAGGRFLNAKDQEEKRRVVFLGSEIAGELFGKENPVGQVVSINTMPFTVVGILQKKMQTAMMNGPDNRRAVIPFSTFQSIYGWRYLGQMLIKPENSMESKKVVQLIRNTLARKYQFDSTDENAVGIWDVAEMERIQEKIFLGINIFLAVIGGMTLVIAGVGVANIMYVVVKERTREIGIKRAMGAKRRHILSQFVFEALLLAVIGGSTGLLISFGIVKAVWMVPAEQGAMQFLGRPLMSNVVIGIAIGVLGLTGILAGLFPARKAAKVDPIEALRYE